MFEECTTLAELNQARVRAASGGNIVEVNNAYNTQRRKILMSRQNFTQLSFKTAPTVKQQAIAVLPYKGRSSRRGVIEIKRDGIYV